MNPEEISPRELRTPTDPDRRHYATRRPAATDREAGRERPRSLGAPALGDGWTYGAERNDPQKKHPCLIPYDQLPDSEKEYDRNAAMETLKAIIALGYRIEKHEPPVSG